MNKPPVRSPWADRVPQAKHQRDHSEAPFPLEDENEQEDGDEPEDEPGEAAKGG